MNQIIANKRKELKLTQRELAEKLNVTDKTVSRWENGTTLPDVDLIPSIAKVLGISIEELFTGKDNNETKREEKYDFKRITTFKIGNLISYISTLFAIIFFFASRFSENETLSIILTIISVCNFVLGLFVFISTKVSYRSFYQGKYYQDQYVDIELTFSLFYYYALLVIIGSISLFIATLYLDLLMLLVPVIGFFGGVLILKRKNRKILTDLKNKVFFLISVTLYLGLIILYLFPILNSNYRDLLKLFILYLLLCSCGWLPVFRFKIR